MRVLTTNANGREVLALNTPRECSFGESFAVRYCARIARNSVSVELLRELPAAVEAADLVHLTAVYSFPTLPVLAACRHYRKPLVWSPRGALQRWRGSRRGSAKLIWEMLCRALMPPVALMHVTSAGEREESLHRMPHLDAVIVPNGIAIPPSARRESGADELRLGFIGRLDPKKGIENLLEACAIVLRSGLRMHLLIAGGGEPRYEASLRRRIETLGLGESVEMCGPLGDTAKRHFFRRLDVAITPSFTENFAIVVAEALAHGVPVIASKGTPWERVEEIGCGLWVDNDPRSLASAIARMSTLPLTEMGERGRSWMRREYSWARIARMMLAAYRSLEGAEAARSASDASQHPAGRRLMRGSAEADAVLR